MKFPVRVTPQANMDTEEIAVYIAEGGLDAALRFLDAVERTTTSLAEYPRRGASLRSQSDRLTGIRWTPVAGFDRYMLFYIVTQTQVRVIRVLHGSRDLPFILQGE